MAILAVLAITLSAAPVMAQDDAPAPSSAAAAVEAGTDIVDQLPATLNGIAAETEIIGGLEHISDFDPDLEADAEQLASLESFVSELGRSVEDMTSVNAVAVDGDGLIIMAGIQVAGADPQAMLELHIETVIGQMLEPSQELGELGGKTATRLVDEAFEDEQPLYVYGTGPRVWLLVANEHVVESLLADLP